jgi:hypothetical protein
MSAPDGGALSCQEQEANYWFWTAEEFCRLPQGSVHHCVTDAGQMHMPSHHRRYFLGLYQLIRLSKIFPVMSFLSSDPQFE